MTPRGTALALALLLLTAGASAAPGACCPSIGPERTIRSMDCCASMLEGATSPQAALAMAVRGVKTLPTDHSLPVDPALVPSLPQLTTAEASLGAHTDGPPLYRLHAQLLI